MFFRCASLQLLSHPVTSAVKSAPWLFHPPTSPTTTLRLTPKHQKRPIPRRPNSHAHFATKSIPRSRICASTWLRRMRRRNRSRVKSVEGRMGVWWSCWNISVLRAVAVTKNKLWKYSQTNNNFVNVLKYHIIYHVSLIKILSTRTNNNILQEQ